MKTRQNRTRKKDLPLFLKSSSSSLLSLPCFHALAEAAEAEDAAVLADPYFGEAPLAAEDFLQVVEEAVADSEDLAEADLVVVEAAEAGNHGSNPWFLQMNQPF